MLAWICKPPTPIQDPQFTLIFHQHWTLLFRVLLRHITIIWLTCMIILPWKKGNHVTSVPAVFFFFPVPLSTLRNFACMEDLHTVYCVLAVLRRSMHFGCGVSLPHVYIAWVYSLCACNVCGHVYLCIFVYMCIYVPLCMCACVHVCMCVCVCMCACVHMCMYACVHLCMCVCMYAHSNSPSWLVNISHDQPRIYFLGMYVCMYVCVYVCIYVGVHLVYFFCICLRVYACMHACMYVCMCMHVSCFLFIKSLGLCSHTHTRT